MLDAKFKMKSEYYDAMIDWTARLTRELPFYQQLFTQYKVKTVLDCACGSGRHAVAFAKLGFEVIGADISEPMLEQARKLAKKERETVEFVYADFKRLTEYIPCRFDAIVCVGNSLVQLQNLKELNTTLQEMHDILNPNGILIVQILNFQRLMNQNITPMPLRTAKVDGKELLFLRLYSFPPRKANLDVFTFIKQQGKWEMNRHTTELLPLTKPKLLHSLHTVGYRKLKFYGDFTFSPFNEQVSSDLIFVAHR
ncbi:MAG: methyltransferase domain-containing protein [bacterium]|nr:methyltransferase domain-containing protein [bacterium]